MNRNAMPNSFTGATARWHVSVNASLALALVALSANAAQLDINGPAGSVGFGTGVTALPNGNIVVTDPNGSVSTQGAVYLYSPTGTLISTLTGLSAGDRIGSGGIVVLANGNFLVRSPNWDFSPTAMNAGAVTWVNGNTGLSGAVSRFNSLVGSSANDAVGNNGISRLSNGHYVVRSNAWDNGTSADVGAVTWANASTGFAGVVASANSLIGTTPGDQVGSQGITVLSNGHYVVLSPVWDNTLVDAGAATWVNGTSGLAAVVSPGNSLVGSKAGDQVASRGAIALTNGHYVVLSPSWDNDSVVDAGAATWGNGNTGRTGVVAAGNSLVGTTTGNEVGSGNVIHGAPGATALSNGHYVVVSSAWDNAGTLNVGAVTWGNGNTGLVAAVSPANSLVGTAANHEVGVQGAIALGNGNYVVASPLWDDDTIRDVGAATWVNGSAPLSGVVSGSNSLIGSTAFDNVGRGSVLALDNGSYVIRSALWNDGTIRSVGAVTWCSAAGCAGVVSAANSLVGSSTSDFVGYGIIRLSNNNYVVWSRDWDHGLIANVGAVTWASGSTGLSGPVSPANSLIGTKAGDQLGTFGGGVDGLANGNYLVRSRLWDNDTLTDVGAVTLANGSTGLTGQISPTSSMIGTTPGDEIGNGQGGLQLSDGNVAFFSRLWDNGTIQDAGAVTLVRGGASLPSAISPSNSVLGTAQGGAATMTLAYDVARAQLVVGRPASNIVSLFTLPTELSFRNGFE